MLYFQVKRAKPQDKDAKKKYDECKKITHQLAFERAIAVSETTKSAVESINLDTMCK